MPSSSGPSETTARAASSIARLRGPCAIGRLPASEHADWLPVTHSSIWRKGRYGSPLPIYALQLPKATTGSRGWPIVFACQCFQQCCFAAAGAADHKYDPPGSGHGCLKVASSCCSSFARPTKVGSSRAGACATAAGCVGRTGDVPRSSPDGSRGSSPARIARNSLIVLYSGSAPSSRSTCAPAPESAAAPHVAAGFSQASASGCAETARAADRARPSAVRSRAPVAGQGLQSLLRPDCATHRRTTAAARRLAAPASHPTQHCRPGRSFQEYPLHQPGRFHQICVAHRACLARGMHMLAAQRQIAPKLGHVDATVVLLHQRKLIG